MNNYSKTARLGDILLHKKEITQDQLNECLRLQKGSGKKLGEILIEKDFVTEDIVLNTLSEQLGIEIVNLDNFHINAEATKLISEKLAKRVNAIPLKTVNDKIYVAMSEPLNIFDIEDIEMESGKKTEILLAAKSQINYAIEKYMGRRSAEKAVEDFNRENLANEDFDAISEETDINVSNSPVVRLINSLIRQALKMGASDIHIEPLENRIRVRVRIDGELQEILTPSKHTQSALVTRVKIIAGMNIAEKRLPQDGRIEMKIDDTIVDLRISVLPTVYGEKIVMRLLDRGNFLKNKKELGFTHENLEIFETILGAPNGVILVTGPTGSGKTTTLYASLNVLNKMNKNIITVEDPVEYKIEGINQVQVNSKAGLLFSTGLRSILRQDPDIIMVGEIRDEETAEIAVRAAITGHLVISTLHTNDAPSTIMRLQDMGIKPFLIAASVRGIVAQRLVKRVCTNCKEEYKASETEKSLLGIEFDAILQRGAGCPKCFNTGYSGRIAIHEILKVDKAVREAIQRGKSSDEITKAAEKGGMTTLKENCRELVLCGITTMEEYSQVVYKLD
ncbi:type II/IV secretion system protein [Sedimentibacter hydroxybenzoicus DSM 7310]|uniref:Type II/IV secretion system protein n=1 Tax=Sedimentibacter hydroxybenzoicus DSM 7310 TaxID=1123245 RepID=A0A974GWB3_SEDHY|nr:GspE/PulE family protein [Sedimentibacter hydroxybenzoicus]NYB74302.1 type II/IV secretion system protein [Sedimentibacter hydroxybenzoicus DSM 7310]